MRIQKRITVLLVVLMSFLAFPSCALTEKTDMAQGKMREDTQTKQAAQEKEVIMGHADCPHYATLDDLENKADYILYGTVLSKRYEWRNLRIGDDSDGVVGDPFDLITVYEVSVIKNYKSTENNVDVINVFVIGGETENKIYKFEDFADIDLDVGKKYVFFLGKSVKFENGAWLLNGHQSLYKTDGTTISGPGFGLELSFERLEKMLKK